MGASKANLPQFIEKLYCILNGKRYAKYVGWGQAGNSFIIIDPAKFCNDVLAEHFKHRNMSSFVRQLNKYDFHKVKSNEASKAKWGQGMWEFAHKNFVKNRKDLLWLISRKLSAPEKKSINDNLNESKNSTNNNAPFYTYLVNTMSSITRYFDLISDDLTLVKKIISGKFVFNSDKNELKVLIAEDNPSCTTYAASIFKRNNYSPVAVKSVKELKFLLEMNRFSIVLLSGCIPDVVDIIRNVRSSDPDITVVLTIDEPDSASASLSKYRDVDKVLYKPYLHEELVSVIIKQQLLNKAKKA